MTKKEKRIHKIIQNPKNVTFEEIDRILLDEGFLKRNTGGGSHFNYKKEDKRITIPYNKPYIKQVYIKEVAKLLGVKYEDQERS